MNINMKTVKLNFFTQSASRKCLQVCQITTSYSSIRYGHMEGSQNKKMVAADLHRRP